MRKGRLILVVVILGVAALAFSAFVSRKRQEELNNQISEAAREGDFTRVADLLEQGANPNGLTSDALKAPLFYAVSAGEGDAVRNLVDAGAELDNGGLGARVLRVALERQDLEMFELLLKLGVDPNARIPGSYDFNTLHWVVENRWREDVSPELCVKFATLAVQAGANMNDRGMNGFTPLRYAVGWELPKLVEFFLDEGADPAVKDDEGMNSMDAASFRANERLISLLRMHGAPFGIQEAAALGELATVENLIAANRSLLNKRCFGGNSPLGVALLNGHARIGNYLMAEGASLEHLNVKGESPLHLAARGDCVNLIELLLDRGLQINQRDNSEETPLHETTFTDCTAAAEVLIRRGADIHAKQSSRITPALWCASYDSPGVLTLLLEAGVDPNAPAADGALPLGSACHYSGTDNVPETVKVLLAAGAEVNKKDQSGRTPLHWAVQWQGGKPLVSYLLDHGADPSLRDAAGRDALQIAAEKGDAGLRLLLKNHMEKSDSTSGVRSE